MSDLQLFLNELKLSGFDVDEFNIKGGWRQPTEALDSANVCRGDGTVCRIARRGKGLYVTVYTDGVFGHSNFVEFEDAADFISKILRDE